VRWLWDGWLARGKFHIMAGAAGTGKTTLALSIAATVSAGTRWPDGTAGEHGDVLIWSGEDGVADTLLPRLMVAGGNPNRVHFVDGTTEHGKGRPFDPATDMPALMATARLLPNLRLMILDPVVSAVSGDSHKNTETRRGLQPVVDLAGQLDCALLGISHFSKATAGRDPLERVAGSIAFGAVARVVLATVKSADIEEPRRLIRAKSNIGPDSGGFGYALFGTLVPGHDFTAQRIDWGEALEGSARELMAVEQMDMAGEAIEEAETFLTDLLREGPVATREIKAAANAHGHAWRTLNRAKDSLDVKATRDGFGKDGVWSWQLPPPPKNANEEC
jgi:putative DNA primase/helicase